MFTNKNVVVAATIAGVFLLAGCSLGDIFDDSGSGSDQTFEESDRDRDRDRGDEGDDEPRERDDPSTRQDEPRERDERPSRDERPAPPPVPEPREPDGVDPSRPGPGDSESAGGETLEIPANFPSEVPLIEGTLTLADQYEEGMFNSFSVGFDVKGDAKNIEAQATELLTSAGFAKQADPGAGLTADVAMITFQGKGDINHVILAVGEYPDEPGNVLVLYNVDLSDWDF